MSVWNYIVKGLRSLRTGEFLLLIGADKFYVHVMYLFVLMWLSIMLSLKVDKTLSQVGDGKAALRELRIQHDEKEAELVKLHSATVTEKRLKELGSKLEMPKEPVKVIKRK